MSHFSEGVLQAYLDGEVDASARAEVDAHLRGCTACVDQLRDLRDLGGEFSAAVRLVEVAPSAVTADQLKFRARRSTRTWQQFTSGSLAKASVLVVGVTLAAAAAVPGSPVQDWLLRAWRLFGAEEAETVQQPAAVKETRAPEEPMFIAVEPNSGRVRISFSTLANGTRVRVGLADSARARVELFDAAASVKSFSSGSGRIAIEGGGVGDIRVTIPRNATEAIVEVDGKLYVNKVGSDLRFYGPAAESIEPDVIFRNKKP